MNFEQKKTYINNSALYWLSLKTSLELRFNFYSAKNKTATFRDAEHTREERLLRISTVTSPHFPLRSIEIPSALQSEELFQSSHSSPSSRIRCWFWISLLIPSVSYCQIYFQTQPQSTQKNWRTCYPFTAPTGDFLKPPKRPLTRFVERGKKILDPYCRKNCHSYEIRNCADKATNSFAVSLTRYWPTPLPPTYTHTHTHTHDTSKTRALSPRVIWFWRLASRNSQAT